MAFALHPTQTGVLVLAALALALCEAPRAAAGGDPEVRQYRNFIDGKYAGEVRMTIARQDDGTVSMTGQARVDYRVLVARYTYNYQGTEVWKDGRLLRLDSTANDNGKRYAVSAAADPNGVRVVVNNREPHVVPADVWLTTYWQLPAPALRGGALALLDADTGRDFMGTLQYLGQSQVTAAGQAQNCNHYRVTGGTQVDLWYDGQDRLVRQEWVEENHRCLLELAAVQR